MQEGTALRRQEQLVQKARAGAVVIGIYSHVIPDPSGAKIHCLQRSLG